MAFLPFYKDLEKRARHFFPGIEGIDVAWNHLISPVAVRLPKRIRDQAQAAITAFYQMSRRPEYAAQLEQISTVVENGRQHRSVLMAYDFHTTENGECRLVEINTNASGFLLSSLMEMTHRNAAPEDYAPLKDLRKSFENELKLFGKNTTAPTIAITDDDLREQRMWLEFVMYNDLFQKWGWTSSLCEAGEFQFSGGKLKDPAAPGPCDLVYNRTTDFYLQEPHHAALLNAFTQNAACITPNPREYWLLADKQRLIQFSQPEFAKAVGATASEVAAVQNVLIPTFEKSYFGSDEDIWSQRKNLFFKPKRSYGGKSVYRGESVSRKVFERLMTEDILIQQFQPAQRVPTDDPRSVLNNWKFDLRFFVYEDRIQIAAARIYQGQVTNFASEMGGFTLVEFSD